MPLIKVIRHGQVTLPAEFRQTLAIRDGDYLEAQLQQDQIVLKPTVVLDRAQAIKKLQQLMNRVGKRHEHIPEAKVEQDVLEAIQTVRQQDYAKKKHDHTQPKSRR